MPKTKTPRYNLQTSPLLLAVEFKKTDDVRKLLANKGDVDIRDRGGCTPLIRASFLDAKPIMRLLLKAGANVNAIDDLGWCALHYYAQEKNPLAAQLLIDAGADVDIADRHGNTPLFKAIFNNTRPVIALLLKAGADPKRKNAAGVSPAALAKTLKVKL